jgi:hypothetical protein
MIIHTCTCDEELQAATAKWFREQPEQFYNDGFKKRIQRWQCCIEREGDYVETRNKLFYAFFHLDTLSGSKETIWRQYFRNAPCIWEVY